MQSTKFCCTMKSESGIRKDANTRVYEGCFGAIVVAGEKEKADARMCVVCRGYKTHEEKREKGNFCMCDRFSADGFRTRAARVIRRRVLGVWAAKGKTGKWGKGRPGDSWALGKRGVCVCVCSVSAGREPEGRFTWENGVCVGVRCVSKGRGPEGRFKTTGRGISDRATTQCKKHHSPTDRHSKSRAR